MIDLNLVQNTQYTTKHWKRINQTVFCAPWDDTYLHNSRDPSNLNNQTLINYSCLNAQINTINKHFEELDIIELKPVNKYIITGEITKLAP